MDTIPAYAGIGACVDSGKGRLIRAQDESLDHIAGLDVGTAQNSYADDGRAVKRAGAVIENESAGVAHVVSLHVVWVWRWCTP
jgi:hypothetical protein